MPASKISSASTLPSKGYAAMTQSADLKPWSFERRTPGPHDVQADILYCGVCHSDLHSINNDWGMAQYPLVPGHEIIGRVKAVGDHVSGFKVGDLIGVGCLVDSCRECENCKDDLEQYCTGGMTMTYGSQEKSGLGLTKGGYSNNIVVDENYVLKVSEKLPIEKVAPLLCAGITTYSPLRHWKVSKGQRVAIVGLGGLGHMGVKFAVSFGAEVTVLSTSPSKEKDALALGAHKFVLTNTDDIKKYAGYFDFILDTVSAEHNYESYLGLLRRDGAMVIVGLPTTPVNITPFTTIFQRRTFAGSLIGGIKETQEMLDYCAEHNITSDVEVIPISGINDAFKRMVKNDVKYRFVIDMATI